MNRNRPVPDVYSAAVEKAKLEARKRGHSVFEQALGQRAAEQLTGEFHQGQQQTGKELRQSN